MDFREDVALLRALAIIVVLGYHFYPEYLPMGYLGVDIFFVISGYLIMMILKRTKGGSPPQILFDFYYRRFKRIFPLYYLAAFGAGFWILFVYRAVWAKKYFDDYLSALLLYLNIRMLDGESNYFGDETSDIPFLHFWTLSVEIQFYLVAPFLFFFTNTRIRAFRIGHLLLPFLAYCSLSFAQDSSSIRAFYHPFSRLWQFLVGMLAAMYAENLNSFVDSSKSRQKLVTVASAIVFLVIFPVFLPFYKAVPPPNYPQFLTTIAAGLFMFFGSRSTIDWSFLRLGYMASLSYSLYLVHYPILRFSLYLSQYHEIKFDVRFATLAFVFCISILLHHLYEKPMLREKRPTVIKEVLKYFLLSLLIQWKWPAVVHPELTLKTAVNENARYRSSLYILRDGKFLKGEDWKGSSPFGHYQFKNGTGNHSVVIIGNSWAAQQAHIVREILPSNYVSTMDLFTWSSYVVPFDYQAKRSEAFWAFMKKSPPNILFILTRWLNLTGHLNEWQGREKDPALKRYLQVAKNLSLFAEHIFIEGHQPVCPCDNWDFMKRYIGLLEKGADLRKANRDFDEVAYQNYSIQLRLKALVKECPKCHLLDLGEPFIDRKQKKVRMYDSKTEIAYLDNICHLTAPGLQLIKKPFRETVERVLGIGAKPESKDKKNKPK